MKFTKDLINEYIDQNEILRYLNHKGNLYDRHWHALLEEILEETILYSDFLYTFTKLSIDYDDSEDQLQLSGVEGTILYSKNLRDHLYPADELIVVGLTLGHRVERQLKYYMKCDMTRAVIMDACSSVVVEAFCDWINDAFAREINDQGQYLSTRFSPGYGDLLLSTQAFFAAQLQLTKKIGVHVTESHLMVPQKSVVFLMGKSSEPNEKSTETCGHKCASCTLKSCQYRSGGL